MSETEKDTVVELSKRLQVFKEELEKLEFDLKLYGLSKRLSNINLKNVCPVCGAKQKVECTPHQTT